MLQRASKAWKRAAVLASALVAGSLVDCVPAWSASRFEGSLGLLLGFPSGDYGDQIEGPGFGIDLDGGWRPADSPAVIGARFGFLVLGTETRREPLSETLPIPIEVKTTNNQLFGHLMLRLEPPRGAVRPFVEGVFGFSYLYTETSVNDVRDGSDFAGVKQLDDTVLSYGGGGGLKVKVWGSPNREKGKVQRVFVTTRVDYLVGGEGEYLKKGTLQIQDGRFVARRTNSKTDIVTLSIGASIDL